MNFFFTGASADSVSRDLWSVPLADGRVECMCRNCDVIGMWCRDSIQDRQVPSALVAYLGVILAIDRSRIQIPAGPLLRNIGQLSLHPSGVAKSSTCFGWG